LQSLAPPQTAVVIVQIIPGNVSKFSVRWWHKCFPKAFEILPAWRIVNELLEMFEYCILIKKNQTWFANCDIDNRQADESLVRTSVLRSKFETNHGGFLFACVATFQRFVFSIIINYFWNVFLIFWFFLNIIYFKEPRVQLSFKWVENTLLSQMHPKKILLNRKKQSADHFPSCAGRSINWIHLFEQPTVSGISQTHAQMNSLFAHENCFNCQLKHVVEWTYTVNTHRHICICIYV